MARLWTFQARAEPIEKDSHDQERQDEAFLAAPNFTANAEQHRANELPDIARADQHAGRDEIDVQRREDDGEGARDRERVIGIEERAEPEDDHDAAVKRRHGKTLRPPDDEVACFHSRFTSLNESMDGRRHGQRSPGAGRNCIPRGSSIDFADDAREVAMALHDSGENAALSALNDDGLEGLDLEGHWRLTGAVLGAEPRPVAEANLWRWTDIRRVLMRAGELRAIDGAAGRRTVRLCTPGLAEKWATRTIHASFQLVKAGETAEAHRHSLGALRFVVEGSGGHTTVEGEKFVMEPGDLVLTPQNTWHDHGNASDAPMIWIDGHDGPLTLGLNALFMERYGAETSRSCTTIATPGDVPARCGPAASAHAPAALPTSTRARGLGVPAAMEPAGLGPLRRFVLDYVDPVTGGYTMPTIACRLHRLPAGQSTRRQRETSSRIYNVVRGTGSTVAGAKTLNWLPGDAFVVPGWCWCEHRASDGRRAVRDERRARAPRGLALSLRAQRREPAAWRLTGLQVQRAGNEELLNRNPTRDMALVVGIGC